VAKKQLEQAVASFRRPRGLRLEESAEHGTLVVSFPVPGAAFQGLLTGTETAIAQDILAGLSNADIARGRGTAVRTIANQVASIYRKLRVRSRLELSLLAVAGRHKSSRHEP
jgi:DNA-binding NarL/FixJ family response regulator